MVTKKKKRSTTEKRGKEVNKPKLNKETVKDLTHSELEKAQGGIRPRTGILCTLDCLPPPIIK